jgi:uncharacterized repeat protein (TIGR02059 family)
VISQIKVPIRQKNVPLKNALIILFLVFNTIASATNYYIRSSGNDTNNGLSSSAPWKTIAKVNVSSFLPGDTIFFNKGDTWREQLTAPSSGKAGAYIVFSSYGTGVAPKILGSTEVTAWTNDGGNVWYSNNEVADPYALDYDANIYFKETDGAITWGRVKKAAKVNLAVEYDWVWITNHIYIYSPIDPNIRYSGIEVSQLLNNINLNNKNYIAIDGLEIAYSGSAGIDEGWPRINLSGLIIKNCTIHHIGIKASYGAYGLSLYHSNMLIQNNIIHDSGRRNISLNIYNGNVQVHDIIVEGNTLYHGFHTTGVDMESDGVGTLDKITIRNNLIYDDVTEILDEKESYSSTGVWVAGGVGLITNLYIYNNIIKNTTKTGVDLNAITSAYIYNNTFYGVNPNIPENGLGFVRLESGTNCTIKNNIFYNNVNSSINGGYGSIILSANKSGTVTSDYNLFYDTDAAQRMVYWDGTHKYTTAQWAAYKSELGQDTHSPTPANPLFVSSSDYHLQTGSPAINIGIDVGLPFSGKAPDLGAFELQNASTILIPLFVSAAVENSTPSILGMIYNITLANVTPSASAFSVRVNSVTRTVNTVAISGKKVMLTLSSPVVYGNVVTVSYTKPTSNPLQATSTGVAASISDQPVNNNCINGTTTVNQPPVVTVSNPSKGNKYENLATITIDATAYDPDGTVIKVEFYSGSEKLIELTSVPYSYIWKDVEPGTYYITAIATDNLNATTTSSPIKFEVVATSKYDANSDILNLYPNPNDGHFSLELLNPLQNEKSKIIISDLAGKQVYQGTLLKEETIKQIDLSYIKSGIYLLMIIGKVIIVTKKIIID